MRDFAGRQTTDFSHYSSYFVLQARTTPFAIDATATTARHGTADSKTIQVEMQEKKSWLFCRCAVSVSQLRPSNEETRKK